MYRTRIKKRENEQSVHVQKYYKTCVFKITHVVVQHIDVEHIISSDI
jgi:hypothetical protein